MWRQSIRFVTSQGNNYANQRQQQQPRLSKRPDPNLFLENLQLANQRRKQSTAAASRSSDSYVPKIIPIVEDYLQDHLFPNTSASKELTKEEAKELNDKICELMMLDLPELDGAVEEKGLMAHFDQIGKEQFERYGALLEEAMKIAEPPPMPSEWSFTTGWTKYNSSTGTSEAVPFPDEKVIFFDVEVCVPESNLACLAVAMSPTSWYSWCSDRLINDSKIPELTRFEHLVPLEQENGSCEDDAKIVIGHNVGFDRARTREVYYQKRTGTRFWDTMSMSIAVQGMAEHQRSIYNSNDLRKSKDEKKWRTEWRKGVSLNGLGAVHAHLCGETTKLVLDKSMQDVFLKEPIETIREHFQVLTKYCAQDVQATYEVFQKLYPMFQERMPNSITYVGMLEMASAYLPINQDWRNYYQKCNESAEEQKDRAAQGLAQGALELSNSLRESYQDDPWMWICDWEIHKKLKKPKWYLNLYGSANKTPFEDGDDKEVSAADLKFRCRDVPRIFGICYGPFPVHFKTDMGWGYLVPNESRSKKCKPVEMVKTRRGDEILLPNEKILNLIEKNRSEGFPELPLPEKPDAKVGAFDFYRFKHPTSEGKNVGSPFTKDYLKEFSAGLLRPTRFEGALNDYLDILRTARFWGSYKERIKDEITVWYDEEGKLGAIAPAIVPAGTVTRRSTHKLWLVSTSPKQDMIGTSIKSMVQAPEGYKIVGADVDSQEQWIAALLGDFTKGEGKAGATAFANMLLEGNKKDKSDLHSVVARQVGVKRDHAKVLNYARLYGAGKKNAIGFLKQQGTDEKTAEKLANILFETTKGAEYTYQKLNNDLRKDFEEFLQNECPEKYQDQHLIVRGEIYLPTYAHIDGEQAKLFEEYVMQKRNKRYEKTTDAVIFLKELYPEWPDYVQLYKGGFESDTFNFLETEARKPEPRTPVLGCRLSRALESPSEGTPDADKFDKEFKRSRINWFVQSSAVDFLHMLIVCFEWLSKKYDIDARFMLSIHDEIRYLVKEEDVYRAALALNFSNMYVRAAISQKLGIHQLPKSVAFFSQVDVDTVLRKEVNLEIVTPTGAVIPSGTALTMEEVTEKTKNSDGKATLVKNLEKM